MALPADIDMAIVAELLRKKRAREQLSLRDAAAKIKVSAPTLQRIEAGQVPTSAVLLQVLDWIGVTVDQIRRKDKSPRDPVAQIEVFLRADPNLDRKAADAIATMVREVYDVYVKGRRKR